MNLIARQLQHNAWANRVVLDGLRRAPALWAAESFSGIPAGERLRHLAGVERGFLDCLRGAPARPEPPLV